jgi:excisionase family DNA binding protein
MNLKAECLSIADTVNAFGIGRTKLFQLIAARHIQAVKIGRRTLVKVDSVRAFIDSLPAAASKG